MSFDRRLLPFAAALLLAIAAPLLVGDVRLNQLTREVSLVLAVLGVSILTGRAGLVSLGHGVFVGIGAFATARLAIAGAPLVVAGLAATLIAGAFGIVLGLPALRVRGPYLALITLGTALSFGPLSKQVSSLTGGSSGLVFDTSAYAAPEALGGAEATSEWRWAITIVVIAAWFWLAHNLIASRVGRAVQAAGENELAAATFGVDARRMRTGTLGVTAAMAGTAGALHALSASFVINTEYDALLSFRLYAAAVLGGAGRLPGALFGVVFLVVVPEVADRFTVVGNQDVMFGLALIVVTLAGARGNRSRA